MLACRLLQKHMPYKNFVECRNANVFIRLYPFKNNTKAGQVLLLLNFSFKREDIFI